MDRENLKGLILVSSFFLFIISLIFISAALADWKGYAFDIGETVCVKNASSKFLIEQRGFHGEENRYWGKLVSDGFRVTLKESDLVRCQ